MVLRFCCTILYQATSYITLYNAFDTVLLYFYGDFWDERDSENLYGQFSCVLEIRIGFIKFRLHGSSKKRKLAGWVLNLCGAAGLSLSRFGVQQVSFSRTSILQLRFHAN